MSELTDPPLTIPAGTQVVAREGVRDEKEHKRAGALPPAPQPDSLRPSIIYRCVVGSRAFGLDDASSDTDRRGIYLPPARLHWSLAGLPEQIEDPAAQECYWGLGKSLTLALKANPTVLECLSTPLVEHATPLRSAKDYLAVF